MKFRRPPAAQLAPTRDPIRLALKLWVCLGGSLTLATKAATPHRSTCEYGRWRLRQRTTRLQSQEAKSPTLFGVGTGYLPEIASGQSPCRSACVGWAVIWPEMKLG